ncbi:hypothetical protein D3P07_04540 [Paenibacillus sp. 1011MAR3C5]|uniref:hypothetical protein n=1 Tax=Paenibacillus sp. 1011MAR3C5 TaxID=1675787 RepID=UPI000E6CAA61|nr:hypothetical protein [Paenibacillus sp. 1011MAR3C5]RJE91324.1 hypothetical protein D3P07_04540 [Paenibacillus sp. 1011MAR3C5]
MEQIYPLREEVLSTYGGMPVVVFSKSGYRQLGIIRSCQSGKLVLGNPYSSCGAAYYARVNRDSTATEADQSPRKTEMELPVSAAGKKNGKKKRAKAAGLNHSPTKYASKGHNPSLSAHEESPDDTLKLDLDDIAFVFLIV